MGVIGNSVYAPWPPETEERLRVSSVLHFMDFTLEYGDLKFPLEYQGSVSLTFDENWAPYAQLQGAFRWVGDTARGFLDPRLNAYIRVKAGYGWDAGDRYIYDICRLHLRSVNVKAPEMAIDLTAASSECLLQDYLWPKAQAAEVPTASIAAALRWCMDTARVRGVLTSEVSRGKVQLPDQGVKQGANIWDLARDIAAGGNAWFYHDGLEGWRLKPRPTPAGTPRCVLQTGGSGTIVGYEIAQSREEYAEGIIVRHSFREEKPATAAPGAGRDDGRETEIVGRAMVGNPRRWRLVERTTPITEAGAKAEAENLLRRYMDMRRQVNITAKAAYWLRPGDTVSVHLPGIDLNGRVSRVQFAYPAGRMNVKIVLPESEG